MILSFDAGLAVVLHQHSMWTPCATHSRFMKLLRKLHYTLCSSMDSRGSMVVKSSFPGPYP